MFTVAWKTDRNHHSSERQHPDSLIQYLFPAQIKTRFFLSYLEFLSPDGLHLTLFTDGELVCDLGVGRVELGPGEVIPFLGDLCDHLVVTTFLDDVVRDSWSGMKVRLLKKNQTRDRYRQRKSLIPGPSSYQPACRTRRIHPGSRFPIFQRRPLRWCRLCRGARAEMLSQAE